MKIIEMMDSDILSLPTTERQATQITDRYRVERINLKDSGDLVLEVTVALSPALAESHNIRIPKPQLDEIISIFKRPIKPPTEEDP